jgi:hypothetical protein
MARYVKKFKSLGSTGPTEERGFAIWAGYDIVGVDGDLAEYGLQKVDDWDEARLAALGVTKFLRVEPDDGTTYATLGIPRNR